MPFSGNKIDFTRPIFDYGKNREELGKILKLDIPKDKSLAETRALYIESKLAEYIGDSGKPEAIAKMELGSGYDELPLVVQIKEDAAAREAAHWEGDAEGLLAAIEGGLIPQSSISEADLKILRAAELLK